jgi:O-antigen/teichoic acid export membrane protein
LLLALLAIVLTNSVLLPGANLLLSIFGPEYAEQGSWSLRFLALGALPFFIKEFYIAICRIQDRLVSVLLPLTAGAFLEVVAAILGARLGGASGLSLGWLIAVCIEAIVMSGTVYKIAWPTDRYYRTNAMS